MWTLLLVLGLGPSHAADPLLDAFSAEVERASELQLPDQGPPHHVLVRGTDGWTARASASFGALMYSNVSAEDDLHFEVRAGTPEYDSAGLKSGWDQPGFDSGGVPDVPTVRSVRETVWRYVDREYKSAVENLGRKLGAKDKLQRDGERPPDWQTIDNPTVDVRRTPIRKPEVTRLEGLVRDLSGRFKGRRLQAGTVTADVRVGHRVLVASDGTRLVQPIPQARVWASVTARADERATARPTWVQVTPSRAVSKGKLWKAAAKLARQQGEDRVLIISSYDRKTARWRYLDGREEPVRGFKSPDFDARSARSMTIAGPPTTYLTYAYYVRFTVPDLLLSNVAIEPNTPDPESPHRRQSPLLSGP